MITQKQAKRLRQLIRDVADWQETNSWKGGGDPKDWPQIEKSFKQARDKLNAFLRSITEPKEELANEGRSQNLGTSQVKGNSRPTA